MPEHASEAESDDPISDTSTPEQTPPPDPDLLDAEMSAALRRRGGIDWQRTRMTPALYRALLKAQREAKPVGKEGHNTQASYDYALADAMIGEVGRALNVADIVWICANREVEPPAMNLGTEKLWLTATVVTESVCWHHDEKDGLGQLVTIGAMDAIGAASRPNDKASSAAATQLHAYMARDLLHIERVNPPQSDSPDARNDPSDDDLTERGGRVASTRKVTTSSERGPVADFNRERKRAGDTWKVYAELVRQAKGTRPDPEAFQLEHLGHHARTVDDYRELNHRIGEQIAIIRDDASAP